VACNDGDWAAVRRGINGPGYMQHEASYAKYLSICRNLQSIADSWLKFDGIADQRVASKVFDICVNLGLSSGVKLLQRTVNLSGAHLRVDGIFGPRTLEATNACDPTMLLNTLCLKLGEVPK